MRSLTEKLTSEQASLGMQLALNNGGSAERPNWRYTRQRDASYLNWASGQPATGTTDECAVMQADGSWATRSCLSTAVCICQFKLTSPPSPPTHPSPPSHAPPGTRPAPSPPRSPDSAGTSTMARPIVVGVVTAAGSVAVLSIGALAYCKLWRGRSRTLPAPVKQASPPRESHPVIAPDGDVSLATRS